MKKKLLKFLEKLTDLSIIEDRIDSDITTKILISKKREAKAFLFIKEKGVIAGLPLVRTILKKIDKKLKFKPLVKEGKFLNAGTKIGIITGKACSILSSERIILNFLQRLSGIATLTRKFVEKVKGLPVVITDTRKTTPGLRELEKYAVFVGGGKNHRFNLAEAVLIKDNHLALVPFEKIARVFQKPLPLKTEIEVKNFNELKQIIKRKLFFNQIMLDNFKPAQLKKAVKMIRQYNPKIKIEASGGVNLKNVRKIAKTGVDLISIGALTHSAPALDISLEMNSKK